MALEAGKKLGPYEVREKLGAGGMGEVYRATDTRLDREVAIKVLPQDMADDPQSRERFEREARAVSSLNHPHICTLHDVGREDGIDYLVMELVDGDTLAERLEGGQLPLDQSLEYAIQIADALDKAHRQGVVHRDLKPGNIMLTRSGIKLLDFGLAKLKRSGTENSALSQMQTVDGSEPLTAEGTILGTLQYMAPEQLEGKEADARADLFAFGAIVYEMVTGRRAFGGGSQASLIGSILKDEPEPMSRLEAVTPASLDHVVGRCLAKDPDQRWQTAADLMHELTWAMDAGSVAVRAEESATPARTLSLVAASFVVGGLIAFIVFTAWSAIGPNAPGGGITRLSLDLEEGLHLGDSGLTQRIVQGRPIKRAFHISPDGRSLVYLAGDGQRTQLYVRRMDQAQGVSISGTEGVTSGPFFSPDGLSIGFFVSGQLMQVALDGGEVRTISTSGGGDIPKLGASWTDDDRILLSSSQGVLQVPANGGTLTQLTTNDSGDDIVHAAPQMLPGGAALLYSEGQFGGGMNTSDWDVVVESLENGDRVIVTESGSSPKYLKSGHIVFARSGTLMAVGFDVESLEVVGEPVIVVEDLMQADAGGNPDLNTGVAQFSVSDSGALAFVTGGVFATNTNQLNWVDGEGTAEPLPLPPGFYHKPRISPDGTRVAYVEGPIQGSAVNTIWVYDIDLEVAVPLPPAEGTTPYVAWSPDGDQIVYTLQTPEGNSDFYSRASDGSGEPQRLTFSEGPKSPGAWSRNGVLAFLEEGNLMTLSLDGESEPEPFPRAGFQALHPSFSLDGNWLAYTARDTGEAEVYVRPFPEGEPAYRISTGGGDSPVWSPDGDQLFYLEAGEQPFSMMAVNVTTAPSFSQERPVPLFNLPYLSTTPLRSHDIAPDGERFVMAFQGQNLISPVTSIKIVQNWFEELTDRVPTR